MRLIIGTILATLLTSSAVGQTVSYERILLPIVIAGELPGAFGSRWVTHVAITNTADRPVVILGYNPYPSGCVIGVCPPVPPTPANETFFPVITPGQITQGAIIEVDRQFGPDVRFQLRAQDVSREGADAGTELPVVREANFFTDVLNLLDVPIVTAFRTRLRLYDVDAHDQAQVSVRFYKVNLALQSPIAISINGTPPPQPDALLTQRTVRFEVEHRGTDPAFDIGYAEIDDLTTVAELHGVDHVRVEIRPVTTGLRFWAFATVTNNDTQRFAVISPQ